MVWPKPESSLFIKPTVIQFPILFFLFWGQLLGISSQCSKLSSGARGAVSLDHDGGLARSSFESSILAEMPARSFLLLAGSRV